MADENIYIDFYFTYADSGDFYIGQTATVFIDGFAGTPPQPVGARPPSPRPAPPPRPPPPRPRSPAHPAF